MSEPEFRMETLGRPDLCPQAALHSEMPDQMVAEEWVTAKQRTHRQVRCPGCGFWRIWEPKRKACEDAMNRLTDEEVTALYRGKIGGKRQADHLRAREDVKRLAEMLRYAVDQGLNGEKAEEAETLLAEVVVES